MLNDFMNGLEEFKRECNNMSEEEFMKPFYELGIEFVTIEEVKTKQINAVMLRKSVLFNIEMQEDGECYKQQLIA